MRNIKFLSQNLYILFRVRVKALERDGGEPKTPDCALARPQGEDINQIIFQF